MIKLEKLAEPGSLTRNKEKWTQELLEAIDSNDRKLIQNRKKKYNQADVKQQLRSETYGKCAYCESRVVVVAHGDIEHVTPKSVEPHDTFTWENLTFACQICNQNKLDKIGISDPYTSDVDEFEFLPAPILVGRTEKSRITIIELDLNRVEIIEDRIEHMQMLTPTLEKIRDEKSERLKQLLLKSLYDDLKTGRPEYIRMKTYILDTSF